MIVVATASVLLISAALGFALWVYREAQNRFIGLIVYSCSDDARNRWVVDRELRNVIAKHTRLTWDQA